MGTRLHAAAAGSLRGGDLLPGALPGEVRVSGRGADWADDGGLRIGRLAGGPADAGLCAVAPNANRPAQAGRSWAERRKRPRPREWGWGL